MMAERQAQARRGLGGAKAEAHAFHLHAEPTEMPGERHTYAASVAWQPTMAACPDNHDLLL